MLSDGKLSPGFSGEGTRCWDDDDVKPDFVSVGGTHELDVPAFSGDDAICGEPSDGGGSMRVVVAMSSGRDLNF